MSTNAPGWYPDPYNRHESRYWDGGRWTEHVSDAGATAVDPAEWGAAAPSGATAPADPAPAPEPPAAAPEPEPPVTAPTGEPTPPAPSASSAPDPTPAPAWSSRPPVATPPSAWGAPPSNVPPAPPTWGTTAPGGAWSPTAGRPGADARDRIPALVGVIASVVLLVSAFLPWFTVEVDLAGASVSDTVSGIDGSDGVIILVLALVAGALSLLRALGKGPAQVGIGIAIVGLLATLVGVIDLGNDEPDDAFVAAFADVSPAVGLWLVILAGMVITVAGVLVVLAGRARRTSA